MITDFINYLFFCFYSLLRKNDSARIEGATSLLTILFASIIFSIYFLSHIWFDLKFYYPLMEIIGIVILCLIVWFFNRKHFITNKNGTLAINQNNKRNILLSRSIGVFLTIGQLTLFIYSGVITSKHIWQ